MKTFRSSDLSKLSAAELNALIGAVAEHHGYMDESALTAYDGLIGRIKAGPTNWEILVSDGGGGEDWYEIEGDLDDAIAYGEERAKKCHYDFADEDEGELQICVRLSAANDIEFSESKVTRYRTTSR